MLFKNHCANKNCGKLIETFAIDRSGTLPKVFCGSVCQTEYTNQKRIAVTGHSTMEQKQYLADSGRLFNWTSKRNEVDPERMAKIPWAKYDTNSDSNVLNI